MIYNCLYGSKEARYKDPCDITNPEDITGPHSEIFQLDYEQLGE